MTISILFSCIVIYYYRLNQFEVINIRFDSIDDEHRFMSHSMNDKVIFLDDIDYANFDEFKKKKSSGFYLLANYRTKYFCFKVNEANDILALLGTAR